MTEKLCSDRHSPSGEWVRATLSKNVVGTLHRKANVSNFFATAKSAENSGLLYGLEVEPEPENAYDQYALKVYGYSEYQNFFGRKKRRRWHIGYIDKDTARDFHNEFISKNIPINIELYAIYNNPSYLDISYILLAPPGNSFSARMKRKQS